MAASDSSCGTLHVMCFASRLSLQHQLFALGSCATRRHFLQLSHDTQLLDVGSARASCAGLARLLAVTAVSINRLGGRDGRLALVPGIGDRVFVESGWNLSIKIVVNRPSIVNTVCHISATQRCASLTVQSGSSSCADSSR